MKLLGKESVIRSQTVS